MIRKGMWAAFGLCLVLGLAAGYRWFPSPRQAGYRFVLEWGGEDRSWGRFMQPIGIAVSDDRVFVSDAGTGRIQVFDSNGHYIRRFGAKPKGVLSRPMHIDVVAGKVYVADFLRDRIVMFTTAGTWIGDIGSGGKQPARFDAPASVAVDAAGRLLVADFYNQRVQALTPDGRFLFQIGETGRKGVWAGLFNYPTDVAVLADGSLAVADAYNDRIQRFTADGRFLCKWGGPFALNIPGRFNGWFRTATAVAAGPDGAVYVADFYNHRIQKFTDQGQFLVSIGSQGTGPGQFRFPTDVAVDRAGNLYVVDFGNHRVEKFQPLPNDHR